MSGDQPLSGTGWRLALSLVTLRAEVNAYAPDGTLAGSWAREQAPAPKATEQAASEPMVVTEEDMAKANKRMRKAKGNGAVRAGSKTEIVANLLRRKNGCTSAEILKATGRNPFA